MINTTEELFDGISDETLVSQISQFDNSLSHAKVHITPEWYIAICLLEARIQDETLRVALQLAMVVAHKELAEREMFRRTNE